MGRKHAPAVASACALAAIAALALRGGGAPAQPPNLPLPSLNDGHARKAILSFVARVTKEGGPDFVAPAERIAVFDNDGTLWSEQPV